MSKAMRNLLSGATVALGATVAFSGAAIAEENQAVLDQISQYSTDNSVAQVNSVFQLSDVSPSDWAFDALRNLVENYNCIVGYPDGTFRGTRPLSRYEFAAGLNACLQQIERMLEGGGEVTQEDLAALRRLLNEFEAELATLGARVDDLDGRVEFLEDNQFSTTTKLNGEVIFNLGGAFGDSRADGPGPIDDEFTFSNRVRLNLDTSFTGRDRLRTRLEAGNITRLDRATGVDAARLSYDTNNGNDVEIGKLFYRFPVGDNITAYVGAVGLRLNNIFDVTNPYFESSGNGALSRFGRFNPIYRGPDGAGAGFNFDLGERVTFSAAYLADDGGASSPVSKNGLFNGNYTAGAQLDFAPSDNIMLSAVYTRRYQQGGDVNLSGSTGSDFAADPFGFAASSNNFGLQGSWLIGEKFNLGGWVGYTNADLKDPVVTGNADVWNWAVNAALLDVGGEGNTLGFIFGQPPKLTEGDIDFGGGPITFDGGDSTYLAELQYRYKVNNNITITPGAYVLWNPNQDDANDTIVVGTVRTTFSF